MAELPDEVKVYRKQSFEYSFSVIRFLFNLVPTIQLFGSSPCLSQNELTFTLVATLEEVLLQAFEGGLKPTSKL